MYITFYILCFHSEVPLKFVAPLKPVTIDLGGTLSLMCELNQASGDVVWLHDGRDIKPGGRFSISTEGAKRFLTVTDVAKEDEGEYSCECKNDKTSAKVSSKGNQIFYYTWNVWETLGSMTKSNKNNTFYISIVNLMSFFPFSTQTSEADCQAEQCGCSGGKRSHF